MGTELRMSLKEADRLSVMRQVDKKILTLKEASGELGICLRQVKRIRKRYLSEGENGLISYRKGKESNRKISVRVKEQVVALVKTKYADFGPTLAREKLEEVDGIKVSVETLRKWLIDERIWKSKKKKEGKVYQRRIRRSQFGELLQGDGSPHDWFEGRGKRCTLLQFVDDATGRITAGSFEEVENTDGYLRLLGKHIQSYGIPLGIYVDKHSVFRVNREEVKKGQRIAHFGEVVKELGIELICANSPQAKGRVERKNGLLQDRLVKELRLAGINDREEANKFLPKFFESINKKFGRTARDSRDAHRTLKKGVDLRMVFARKESRKLSKDLTFQYNKSLYCIQTKTPNRMKHATVNIFCEKEEVIEVNYKGNKLAYKKWSGVSDERPQVYDAKEIATIPEINVRKKKPGKHHPWR